MAVACAVVGGSWERWTTDGRRRRRAREAAAVDGFCDYLKLAGMYEIYVSGFRLCRKDFFREMLDFGGVSKRLLNSCNALLAWPPLDTVRQYRIKMDGEPLDLHGFTRYEAHAMYSVHIAAIFRSKSWPSDTIKIITGKGLHSVGGIPVIKNSLIAYLEAWGFRFKVLENNAGVVAVYVR